MDADAADPAHRELDRLFGPGPILLDGGLATELERHGHDLRDPLWSAKLLLESPEAIERVHRDYACAGSRVLIGASYQASFEGLARRGLDRAASVGVFRSSVELARRAAADSPGCDPIRVAASIGPFGALLADGSEFRGGYGIGRDALIDFHLPRMETLLDAEPDLLACETIPSLVEAEAIARCLERCGEPPAWISATLRDADRLAEGQPLAELAALAESSRSILAVGTNCVAPSVASAAAERIARTSGKPRVCYANAGEVWDDDSRSWLSGSAESDWLSEAVRQVASGVRLIGGCCRTRPDQIGRLARKLDERGSRVKG